MGVRVGDDLIPAARPRAMGIAWPQDCKKHASPSLSIKSDTFTSAFTHRHCVAARTGRARSSHAFTTYIICKQ